jgi:hypothetical protein
VLLFYELVYSNDRHQVCRQFFLYFFMILPIVNTIFCLHGIVVNIGISKGKSLVLECMELQKRLYLIKSAIVVERVCSCISQVRSILL